MERFVTRSPCQEIVVRIAIRIGIRLSLEDGSDTLRRVEIITGSGRRRRWSTDAKAAIVAESFAPGASASGVARRHDISASLLFLWCRQATRAKLAERRDGSMPSGFVPVAITDCGGKLEQGAIEIEVGAVRIRVMSTVDRRALCEVLASVGTVGR